MRTKYKPWAVEYLETNTKNEFFISDNEDDILAITNFIKEKETFLEIGPGKGRFICNLAKRYPEYNFLVIELNKTISGIALKAIDEAGLNNAKLICGNFYDLVKILKKVAFCGIFLNFSDPWPKKRHEKRRLTHPLFLVEYAKILSNNGKLYIKSDNKPFFDYSIEQFKLYEWNIDSITDDYKEIDIFDEETEFEAKFKKEGIKINRAILSLTKETKTALIDEKN